MLFKGFLSKLFIRVASK